MHGCARGFVHDDKIFIFVKNIKIFRRFHRKNLSGPPLVLRQDDAQRLSRKNAFADMDGSAAAGNAIPGEFCGADFMTGDPDTVFQN